jgi:hypothetical protein
MTGGSRSAAAARAPSGRAINPLYAKSALPTQAGAGSAFPSCGSNDIAAPADNPVRIDLRRRLRDRRLDLSHHQDSLPR